MITEWTFGFWQMLAMLFIMYQIGLFWGEVKATARFKVAQSNSKTVKIDIEKIGDMYFVTNLDTKKFVTKGATYSEIQQNLYEIDPTITWLASSETIRQIQGE